MSTSSRVLKVLHDNGRPDAVANDLDGDFTANLNIADAMYLNEIIPGFEGEFGIVIRKRDRAPLRLDVVGVIDAKLGMAPRGGLKASFLSFGECISKNDMDGLLGAWGFRYKSLTLALIPDGSGIYVSWVTPHGHVVGALDHVPESKLNKKSETMATGELVMEDGMPLKFEMVLERNKKTPAKSKVYIRPSSAGKQKTNSAVLMTLAPSIELHFPSENTRKKTLDEVKLHTK